MVVWWIAGVSLAAIWWDRVRDARGMACVPDLTSPEWDVAPSCAPLVSVIVPARNEEEHIATALASLLAQDYPALEVIAVNDRSSDRTGEIMDSFAGCRPEQGSGPQLRVLHLSELPGGWLGKTHAMWRGAQESSGEWLLFADGDDVFRQDAIRRAIAYAEQTKADHLAMFPRIAVERLSGHMMLAFFQMMFIFGHRPWKVADPRTKDAFGMGAFNLLRKRAYEQVGTWRRLRLEVIEDMRMGELVKQHHLASRCAFGQPLLANHWAASGLDIIHNLTKNFFSIAHYRTSLAIGGCFALLFLNLLPFVGVAFAPGWAKIPFALALAAIAGLYFGMSIRSDTSAAYFFTHPLATILFVYAMLRSMGHALVNGGIIWRGTKYSLEELRRQSV